VLSHIKVRAESQGEFTERFNVGFLGPPRGVGNNSSNVAEGTKIFKEGCSLGPDSKHTDTRVNTLFHDSPKATVRTPPKVPMMSFE